MAFALGTATGRIVLDYDGRGANAARKDVDQLQKSSGNTNAALGKVGRTAGIAGAAVAGGLALAVNAAATFEQRMSGIQAVSGANAKQMDQLRGKALQLGKDTQYSADEAGVAIEELVKAGISIPDVMNGAADSVVNLAAAGEIALPEAAKIASNAMNQFNLKAKDMPGVADALAGAANASAIDVGQLGQSLQQAGAVANLAGVNFKDTTTAIALMGNAGIAGSDAGTSLKSMLMRLQPVTDKQANTMQDLGLLTYKLSDANKTLAKVTGGPAQSSLAAVEKKLGKYVQSIDGGTVGTQKNAKAVQDLLMKYGGLNNAFYDAQGNTQSLAKISGVLHESLKGMTKQQQQAALTTLFGSDAIRAAAIMANNGAKGFDKMTKAMDKVSAADVAKTRMDNFKGSLEQMKGSLETAGIAIGTVLLPPLRSLVDALTSALNWFLNLSDGQQKAVAIFLTVVAAVLLLIAAIVKITQAVQTTIEVFNVLKLAIAETWIAALGPVLLVVAAIAAVVAIVVLLYKKWAPFRNLVNAVWASIKNAISAVVDWFKGVPGMFGSALDAIKGAFSSALGWIQSHWRLIISILLGPLGIAIALITKFWPQIVGVFQAGIGVLTGIWKAFWGVFGGLISAAFNVVYQIIRLAWIIIKGLFILGLRLIIAIVKTELNVIKTVFTAVWNVIKSVVRAGINFVKGIIQAGMNLIKSIISSVWNASLAVINAIWGKIGGTVMGGVHKVTGIVTGAWNALVDITSRIWDAVVNAVTDKVSDIMNKIGDIKDSIFNAFSDAAHWLFDKGAEIIQGLIDGITSKLNAVGDAIHGVADKIGSVLPGSPVREGPLRVLNHGYAGKQIVKMLVDGIMANVGTLELTAGQVASTTAIATVPVSSRGGVRKGARQSSAGRPMTIRGNLTLKGGRAFIEGIAVEVDDAESDYNDTIDRMN